MMVRWTVRLGTDERSKVTVSLASHSHEEPGQPGPYVMVVKDGKHFAEMRVPQGVTITLGVRTASVTVEV